MVKRLFDIFLSLTGLALSLPLWGLIALTVKLEDGGPVLYRQRRVGKDARELDVLKFRSMCVGAEKETGAVWAGENDVRITKVGRLLRATAMDELPQLWNILRGDMSFVGPRPERPELVAKFRIEIPNYDARHAVWPGLTGMAQIYGRYDTSPRHKFYYEVLYIKKQSLWLDIRLILVSFGITFMGRWEDRVQKLPRWLGHGQWRRLSLAGMNPHAGKTLHPPTGQKANPKSLM